MRFDENILADPRSAKTTGIVMFWILGLLALIGLLGAIGHFGLPEKPLPPPPVPAPEKIMEGAAPWFFRGESDVAFLVCHGYGGSPFNTRPLGEFLHSLGHTAIGVLLPGHAQTIEAMNSSRYYHWRDHLEKLYLENRGKYRHFFLVGFSMGGALTLDIAARNADSFRPAGIITISSPVFINGLYDGKPVLHAPELILTGLIKIFRPVMPSKKIRTPSIERLNPWIGYRGAHALNALHSFKNGFRGVRSGLGRITTPYCNIMAANDRTVPSENQHYIMRRIQSREKRSLMFIMPSDLSSMHSLLTHKGENKRVFGFIESFIADVLSGRERGKTESHGEGMLAKIKYKLFPGAVRREPEDMTGLNK